MTLFRVRYVFLAVFCSVLVLVSQGAHALHISQQEFVEEYIGQDIELVLMGAGLQRFTVMKMAAVGLYLPKGIERESVLENGPRRVEVVYLQRVSPEELRAHMRKHISANLDGQIFEQLAESMQIFLKMLDGAEIEDRYAYTYIPEKGTSVEFNGSNIGIIEGEDFAFGLFSTLIGTKPADNRLKRKLLGSLDYNQ